MASSETCGSFHFIAGAAGRIQPDARPSYHPAAPHAAVALLAAVAAVRAAAAELAAAAVGAAHVVAIILD